MAENAHTTGNDESGGSIGRLRRVPPSYYLSVGFLAFLALIPGVLGTTNILLLTYSLFFVMFVISWDFVSGYTGLMSFGHTLFFAVGGYTTAILNIHYGVHPIPGIVGGVILAAIAGLLYGLPARNIEGHYLALMTLLPPLILERVFRLFKDTTGGETGLIGTENLIEMDSFAMTAWVNYYLAFGLFLVIFLLAWVITRSDTGTIFTAIKESEDAVASVGINPNKYKVYAFVMSAMMGGLAGAVFVHTPAGSASPSQLLSLVVIIDVLLASILGGLGTITGAVVGGMTIFWVREWLSDVSWTIPVLDIGVSDINDVLFFLLLLALLMFLTQGLVPWAQERGQRLLERRRADDAEVAADGGRTPDDRTDASRPEATGDRSNRERTAGNQGKTR
ncbi:branched-chain amino acid ABC transporter permease [Halosolutus halophilus]|uniref:branched-chain amino acid ABC transporter permease n=1 Tax=Halosolutus halophilus TaxID=1552990 RepID=UPI002234EE24|nr:branched-chain amino acid ABC transporter permease [Halosolutus halophilus]